MKGKEKKMKRITKLFGVLLACSMLLSLCLTGISFAAEETDFLEDIPYIEDGDKNHLCDIFGVDGTVKPVILEVHGGGFVSGSKETNRDHSIYWADNGFLVVTINYTLMPKGTNKTDMQEFFAALHFIAEQADTYGFDLNNVFVSGDSAGGAHVEMIAANYINPELAEKNEVTVPGNLTIRGLVISASGVVRFKERAEAFLNGEAKGAEKSLSKIYKDEELPSLYELEDWMIADKYPPCVLLGTPGDKLAGEGILELDAYLTEQNIEHELVYVQDDEHELMHVFNITYPDWKESQEANGAAVEFMKAHIQ